MLVKHYPTLLGDVGRCLISVGCWSVQTNPTPSNNVGFQYQTRNYCVFLSRERKCFTVLDEKLEQTQTSSSIVQHHPTLSNMFDCAVQTDQTCCVQQCLVMFDQHIWSFWTGFNFNISIQSPFVRSIQHQWSYNVWYTFSVLFKVMEQFAICPPVWPFYCNCQMPLPFPLPPYNHK